MMNPVVVGMEQLHWVKKGRGWVCKETGDTRTDREMKRLAHSTFDLITPGRYAIKPIIVSK